MDHRQGRAGDPARPATPSNTRSASAPQSNPKLVPLAELQAPKVEPSKLNSKKVTDLMTAAGLLCDEPGRLASAVSDDRPVSS